ncbi:MAG: hypothetical protein LBU58_08200 [Clostridiales bacterium]|jgi:hypothetical protein|nr:hypothetical protein [Clostridiales bacterium]
MTQRRILIRGLIVEAVVFAFLHALIAMGLYAFFADMRPVLLSLLLAAPFFGMFAVRRKAKKLLPFLAAHIALAVWPLLLPAFWIARAPGSAAVSAAAASVSGSDALVSGAPLSPLLSGLLEQGIAPLRACWFAFLLIAAVRSTAVRLRARPGDLDLGFTGFCVGLFAALALLAEHFAMRGMLPILALWAFLAIAGFLVHSQTARVDGSLGILAGTGKKPIAAILRFNNTILAVFLIAVALFAILSSLLPLGRVAGLFGAAALAALRGIVWLIMRIAALFPSGSEEAPLPEAPPPEPDVGAFAVEAAETPAWLEFLESLFMFLLNAALIAGAVAAVAYGAYRLYRRFYAARGESGADAADGDVREYIGPKRPEKPVAAALRAFARRFAPKSEAERVRHLYFRKVRRHLRRGVAIRRADTTGEIAQKILPAEDLGALTKRYDQARYDRARE